MDQKLPRYPGDMKIDNLFRDIIEKYNLEGIRIDYRKGTDTFTIMTDKPGWFVGPKGITLNEFKEKLKEILHQDYKIELIEFDNRVPDRKWTEEEIDRYYQAWMSHLDF